MKISPARTSAFNILIRVATGDAYSSVLLTSDTAHLSERDRSLCYELTLGTLRRQVIIDSIIYKFAKGKKLDPAVLIAARLGLYQLRFLDRIPAYSAINESVHLVGKAGKASAKGFVNALLRNEERSPSKFAFGGEVERISFQTSHPQWLIEKWVKDLGFDTAEQLASSNNNVPSVAFRLTAATTDAGRAALVGAKETESVPGCYTVERFRPELLELAAAGEIYFQDAASQLTARAISVEFDGTFLDVCAAPGSKTTLIGVRPDQALQVAGDIHTSRVKLLRSTCEKQGVRAAIVQYDAERPLPFADGTFDKVLVDAPCTGTGTIRHNPEIRYRLVPEQFVELSKKQLDILKNASRLVKKGGSLIYSTCSIEREENEDVARAFAASELDFKPELPRVPSKFLTSDGYARTFPHRDNMDGFFIASFVKIS